MLIWVEATGVFVVCHLEYLVDTPSSEAKVGEESYHKAGNPVSIGMHGSQLIVSQEGIGVPLFHTNTPGRVSSLCWMQLR